MHIDPDLNTGDTGVLHHVAIGPLPGGEYVCAYQTPGCDAMTVVSRCSTLEQAIAEAARLNQAQAQRAADLERERELCGLRRMVVDLKGY